MGAFFDLGPTVTEGAYVGASRRRSPTDASSPATLRSSPAATCPSTTRSRPRTSSPPRAEGSEAVMGNGVRGLPQPVRRHRRGELARNLLAVARRSAASRPTTPSKRRRLGARARRLGTRRGRSGAARMGRGAPGAGRTAKHKPVIVVGNSDLAPRSQPTTAKRSGCSRRSSARTPTARRRAIPSTTSPRPTSTTRPKKTRRRR